MEKKDLLKKLDELQKQLDELKKALRRKSGKNERVSQNFGKAENHTCGNGNSFKLYRQFAT